MIAEMWDAIQKKVMHDKKVYGSTDAYLESLMNVPSITGDLPLNYLKENKESSMVWLEASINITKAQ